MPGVPRLALYRWPLSRFSRATSLRAVILCSEKQASFSFYPLLGHWSSLPAPIVAWGCISPPTSPRRRSVSVAILSVLANEKTAVPKLVLCTDGSYFLGV